MIEPGMLGKNGATRSITPGNEVDAVHTPKECVVYPMSSAGLLVNTPTKYAEHKHFNRFDIKKKFGYFVQSVEIKHC